MGSPNRPNLVMCLRRKQRVANLVMCLRRKQRVPNLPNLVMCMRRKQRVPESFLFGDGDVVVPMCAGEELEWDVL